MFEPTEEIKNFIIGKILVKKILDGRACICWCLKCGRDFIRNIHKINSKNRGCGCYNSQLRQIGYLKGDRFNKVLCRAKTNHISLDLTFEQLNELYIKQNFRCYYTNIALDECNISLDRLDSNLGYTISNVVWCCSDINWIKSVYSVEDFLFLCKRISEYNEKNLIEYII